MISVCLITYNHSAFIEEAINSVLDQDHDCSWEIVIADDNSTDGTRAIVEQFHKSHPQLIRPILQETNVGPDRNFKELLTAARGKYIAYLEADDFWSDIQKLKKQIDFLEANPAYSACFHDADVIYLNQEKASHTLITDQRTDFSFEDVVSKNFSIPSCSLVFRNQPELFPPSLILLDWVLHLLIAERGKLKKLDGTMAVYRKHSGGWTSKNWTQKALELIDVTERCRDYFPQKYATYFDQILAHDRADVCFGYFQDGDRKNFLRSYDELSELKHLLSSRKRRALEFRRSLVSIPLIARGYSSLANRYREFMFLRRRGT